MQTFLPYENFRKSAECLDTKRLGKQRVEALQILRALFNPNYGWQNHPAVNMWRGYGYVLTIYGLVICTVWIKRGYKDTCYRKILNEYCGEDVEFIDSYINLAGKFYDHQNNVTMIMPSWFNNKEIFSQYRSLLLWKDREHYSQFGWTEKPINNENFSWPQSDKGFSWGVKRGATALAHNTETENIT